MPTKLRTCDKDTGECISCKQGFRGKECSVCQTGLYGPNCILKCSKHCSQGTCDQETGECATCVIGKWGKTCQNDCSQHCRQSECLRFDGSCVHGCDGNYTGDNCLSCFPGWYGKLCDISQATDCVSGACKYNDSYDQGKRSYINTLIFLKKERYNSVYNFKQHVFSTQHVVKHDRSKRGSPGSRTTDLPYTVGKLY